SRHLPTGKVCLEPSLPKAAPCSHYRHKAPVVQRSVNAMDNRPFRIGWLSRQSGVNIETIRYYEREGLLAKPPRTKSGYRSYGPSDARRLGFVRRTRALGFSLDDVRRLLRLADQKSRSCRSVHGLATAHLTDIRVKIAD